MSLDKRLKDAIRAYGAEIDPHGYDDGDEDKAIEAIKQAFIAEGWANKHDTIVKTYKAVRLKNTPLSSVIDEELFMKLPDYMTGPEFLARFEKELRYVAISFHDISEVVYVQKPDVRAAARRAAGVDAQRKRAGL